MYGLLANLVLALHVALVGFVLGGLIATVAGGLRGWRWVRNPWFRLLHIGTIGVVVAEAWLGIVCPLTTLELWLRALDGQLAYDGDFVAYWLRRILFFSAPAWVFTVCYSLFGGLVLLSWILLPPRSPFAERRNHD